MKIAALQTVSTTCVADNLATARRLAIQAVEQGARLLVLPEYFCALGRTDRDKLSYAEENGDTPPHTPIQRAMGDLARELGIWLVAGTLPLRTGDPQRVRNATLVYGPDGATVARYDKIHLFRFDNGRERYDEGVTLQAGTAPVAVEIPDDDGTPLRIGLSICYDLRFPELYRALSQSAPCDLLLVPAAFTATTGRDHWEILLRARAIENQCYVLGAAQGGHHENGRQTWGHSMIVDPWGEVLAMNAWGEGVIAADLDRRRIAQVRNQLPTVDHHVL